MEGRLPSSMAPLSFEVSSSALLRKVGSSDRAVGAGKAGPKRGHPVVLMASAERASADNVHNTRIIKTDQDVDQCIDVCRSEISKAGGLILICRSNLKFLVQRMDITDFLFGFQGCLGLHSAIVLLSSLAYFGAVELN